MFWCCTVNWQFERPTSKHPHHSSCICQSSSLTLKWFRISRTWYSRRGARAWCGRYRWCLPLGCKMQCKRHRPAAVLVLRDNQMQANNSRREMIHGTFTYYAMWLWITLKNVNKFKNYFDLSRCVWRNCDTCWCIFLYLSSHHVFIFMFCSSMFVGAVWNSFYYQITSFIVYHQSVSLYLIF